MVINKTELARTQLKDAECVAYKLLDGLSSRLIYHDKFHTKKIVYPMAIKLAREENFSHEEQILVGIAALFHDTGFLKKYNDNEKIGAEFAENYMKNNKHCYSNTDIEIVKKTIMSTSRSANPQNKLERVLMDADTCLLGSKNYLMSTKSLKNELIKNTEAKLHKLALTVAAWNKHSLAFLKKHKWLTESAEEMLDFTKQENLQQRLVQEDEIVGNFSRQYLSKHNE